MTNTPQLTPIKTALISVSDKTGLTECAQALIAHGVTLLSTGGSAKHLQDANIPVVDVSTITGFPEMMAGRVKTLHPKIHGGILARRDIDLATCEQHEITPIDCVIVNLYPFNEVVAGEHTASDAIENIDIGGPCLLRAAAKNHTWVTVVCSPHDYASLQQALTQHNGQTPLALRQQLAQKAFAHTGAYDASISQYLSKSWANDTAIAANNATKTREAIDNTSTNPGFPDSLTPTFTKQLDCRYGENPHQRAAIYASHQCQAQDGQLAKAKCLQGKALSYNNFVDGDTAWLCVNQWTDQPACVIVKHANPCGVAVADDLTQAYQRAYACDKTSAFGGIIAFNRALDATTAKTIIDQQFVEVIVAPRFHADALNVLASKPNVRALAPGAFNANLHRGETQLTTLSGGLLVQTRDWVDLTRDDCRVVSQRQPTEAQYADCLFAYRVCQFVKSNAIVYAKDNATVGIGAGQMSRVFSARIANDKAAEAHLPTAGAVMASDAFFPFSDSISEAAKVGIDVVIQPGGSKRDSEVIRAADEAGMVMLFTGVRHFRH